jgi:hypothetical protein
VGLAQRFVVVGVAVLHCCWSHFRSPEGDPLCALIGCGLIFDLWLPRPVMAQVFWFLVVGLRLRLAEGFALRSYLFYSNLNIIIIRLQNTF